MTHTQPSAAMRVCTKCKTAKPTTAFYARAGGKGKLHSWCKACSYEHRWRPSPEQLREYQRTARTRHREKMASKSRAWLARDRKANPKKYRDYAAAYRASHVEKCKETKAAYKLSRPGWARIVSQRSALRCKYGLTREDVAAMAAAQGGMCALCGDELGPGSATHIDHDHATNAVRALLCTRCNTGLGLFRDSPEILIAAAKYLQHHAQKERAA